MTFKNLFELKRFIEQSTIKSMWAMRLQDSYTLFIDNDMLELRLSSSGGCTAEYVYRSEVIINNGKKTFKVLGVQTSTMSSNGYKAISDLLWDLRLNINKAA